MLVLKVYSERRTDELTGITGIVWVVEVNGIVWYCGDDEPDETRLRRIMKNAEIEVMRHAARNISRG